MVSDLADLLLPSREIAFLPGSVVFWVRAGDQRIFGMIFCQIKESRL